VLHKQLNVFQLQPGQWTDDASMGLCLADSLLVKDGEFDGSHCRALFFNWWENGFNNAFKLDDSRNKRSVGLGSNIGKSLGALKQQHNDTDYNHYKEIPPRYEPLHNRQDAGNGSLMRLCPIPIFFSAPPHHNPEDVRRTAYESSLTTHPGPMAAEACAFLASLIGACINRPSEEEEKSKVVKRSKKKKTLPAREFLDDFASDYQTKLRRELEEDNTDGQSAKAELVRLLSSSEPEDSTERCWNWKNEEDGFDSPGSIKSLWNKLMRGRKKSGRQCGLGVAQTLQNRGKTYNGYPVQSHYFGSFSLDALAMALYCVRSTASFNEAIVRCINFLGDADTTAAITAQIAGAFYGCEGIQAEWRRDLETWDGGGGFELRAVCLAVRGRTKG
jgi:ADP-ribosyl-[dinitrogen reductase] hydrolase